MCKKIFYSVIILLIGLYLSGCMDNITGSDTLPPTVVLYTPKTGDTVNYRNMPVYYSAIDDQGLKSIELFIDSVLMAVYSYENGNAPNIIYSFDSTYIGKKIKVQLRATDLSGNKNISNINSNILVLRTTSLPSAPKNLKLTRLSETMVNLSWEDSEEFIKNYELWRKVGNGQYNKLKELASNSFNTNDQGLDPNTKYYYKIRSVNDIGFSPFSNEVEVGPSQQTGTLTPPFNLSGKALGTNRIELTWSDINTNRNYFKIERENVFGNFVQVGLTAPNVTTFRDSANGLAAGNEYKYRVKVFSDSDSATSSIITVKTGSVDLPTPTNLVAMNINSKKIKLTWNNNTIMATHVLIERKISGSNNFTQIASITGNLETFSDTTVTTNVTYTYRIRTTDGIIFSEYSTEVTISAAPVTINAPSNLSAVYIGDNKVQLIWTDNSNNESGFIIERRDNTSGTSFMVISQTAENVTLFVNSGVISQRNYTYRVAATDGVILSSYSNEVTLTIP